MSGLRQYDLYIDGQLMKKGLPADFFHDGHVFIHFNADDVFLGSLDHSDTGSEAWRQKYDLSRVRYAHDHEPAAPPRNTILELTLEHDAQGRRVYVSSQSRLLTWGEDEDDMETFPVSEPNQPHRTKVEFGVTYFFESEDYTEAELQHAKSTGTECDPHTMRFMVTRPDLEAGPDADEMSVSSGDDEPPSPNGDSDADWRHGELWEDDPDLTKGVMASMRAQLQRM
jgi:hypothetical protein